MGSGLASSALGNYTRVAYQRNIWVRQGTSWFAPRLNFLINHAGCYNAYTSTPGGTNWGSYFWLGGAGYNASTCP